MDSRWRGRLSNHILSFPNGRELPASLDVSKGPDRRLWIRPVATRARFGIFLRHVTEAMLLGSHYLVCSVENRRAVERLECLVAWL